MPTTDSDLTLSKSHKSSRWEIACWLVALALGFLQAWGRRHDSADGLAYMGADGIAYLDIGDAYLRGDLHNALNAMWSPLYSWLLGLTLHLVRPSPFWEFSVVRLLNFVIYAATLWCFTVFLHSLMRAHRRDVRFEVSETNALPEWVWFVFGYMLFIWTSLMMNHVSRTSPDLLLSAFVYLGAGLVLRIHAGAISWPTFVVFGFLLGMSYLTKSVMFPMAFVFLGVSFLLLRQTLTFQRSVLRIALALLIFLMVATPFILALTRAKHRFTIGDSARLNYAWYVNQTKPFINWQGEPRGSGTPVHPTRQVFTAPVIFEFARPVAGTYPPWYDPSYWYEGATTHFNQRQQRGAITRNLALLYAILTYRLFLLVVGLALFLLFYQSRRGRLLGHDIAAYWFLIAPALAAGGLYLLINIEQRYLAPFVVMIALSLLAAVRDTATAKARRLVSGVTVAVVITFVFAIAPAAARATNSAVGELLQGDVAARDVEWQVADSLRQLGVNPGDEVAVIGNTMFASWPRLARVRVVAEMPITPAGDVAKFWAADANLRRQVMTVFAGTGARVIVADQIPPGATADDWHQIGNTDHFVYFLDQGASAIGN
ncbi:MAG: hypothetical protein ABI967_15005 [bacterium]